VLFGDVAGHLEDEQIRIHALDPHDILVDLGGELSVRPVEGGNLVNGPGRQLKGHVEAVVLQGLIDQFPADQAFENLLLHAGLVEHLRPVTVAQHLLQAFAHVLVFAQELALGDFAAVDGGHHGLAAAGEITAEPEQGEGDDDEADDDPDDQTLGAITNGLQHAARPCGCKIER